MADHTGVFDIANASNDVTIVLNGNSGDVTLGGNGVDGDVTLKRTDGTVAIRLDGNQGNVTLGAQGADGDLTLKSNSGNITIRLDGQTGNVYLGGAGSNLGGVRVPGSDGDLVLRDSAGKDIVHLGAGEQNLVIKKADGTKIIELGKYGNLVAGGGGMDGDLILRDNSGQNRIHLDAGQGNGWFGGSGADGDIVLFPASATHSDSDTTQASIHLNGDAGDIILKNADCAEDFEVSTEPSLAIEPGDVMVLDENGQVRPSTEPYDRTVAGVVSGAADCRPGIILNRNPDGTARLPLALVGRAFCKVDADLEPVAAGDLLASSPTPGHAMKASDSERAFGSVMGKALRPLANGRGLIPILVTLQ